MIDVGIDLGTANTWVVVRGRGPVAHIPSLVVRDPRTHALAAAGAEAATALTRQPGGLAIESPVDAGCIADPESALALLKHALSLAAPSRSAVRPHLLLARPAIMTHLAAAAATRVVRALDVSRARLVPAPVLAALGSGLDPMQPQGTLVIDIGAGKSDVAVVSMGTLIAARTVATGGTACDLAVAAAIRANFHVAIGSAGARGVKEAVGFVGRRGDLGAVVVTGRDVSSGLPREVAVTSVDIREPLRAALAPVERALRDVLGEISAETAADIADTGLVLTGGAARLPGFDAWLRDDIGLPVSMPRDPEASIARGLAMALDARLDFADATDSKRPRRPA